MKEKNTLNNLSRDYKFNINVFNQHYAKKYYYGTIASVVLFLLFLFFTLLSSLLEVTKTLSVILASLTLVTILALIYFYNSYWKCRDLSVIQKVWIDEGILNVVLFKRDKYNFLTRCQYKINVASKDEKKSIYFVNLVNDKYLFIGGDITLTVSYEKNDFKPDIISNRNFLLIPITFSDYENLYDYLKNNISR